VAANALVVDDRSETRQLVAEDLLRAGLEVTEARDGVEGWQRFLRCGPDVVVSDLALPGKDGLALLKRIREVSAVPVILFSDAGDVGDAVAAMKAGAQEFFRFPRDRGRIAERARLLARDPAAFDRLDAQLVGESDSIRRARERIRALAPLRVPVLMSGEAGSGRHHVARCIAELASFPPARFSRLTRETVAAVRSPDVARIYYLDDFDKFSPSDQARWLAWVPEVGDVVEGPRVLASTSRSAAALLGDESVCAELVGRLLRFEIPLAALRERSGDIPSLARHLANRISAEMGREQVRIDPAAAALLASQVWAGNVGELYQALEKLVAFSPDGHLTARRVREICSEARGSVATLRERRNQRQRDELIELLERCGGNIAEVARRLDLSRGAVVYRAQKHGLLPKPR
jgi:DNA-binding NtrC family response regulator